MNILKYPVIMVSTIILFCSWKLSEQLEDRNCIHQCGNISIPYPFGIGPNHCSKDPYFAVSCEPSSSTFRKPFLKLTKFEILEVNKSDFKGTGLITVKIPLATVCNTDDTTGSKIIRKSPNLNNSSFTYSTDLNVLASVGCYGYALLYNEVGESIAGCTSVCGGNPPATAVNGSKCYGYQCCQVQLPNERPGGGRGIDQYGIQVITTTNNTSRNCRSAFLISKQHLKDAAQLALAPETTTLPVVIQWGTYSSTAFAKVYYPSVAVYIFPVIICGLFWGSWRCQTKKRRKEIKLRAKYFKENLAVQESSSRDATDKTKLFTLAELKTLTDNFSKERVLGKGGQGTVYKGMLKNGHVVAIKKSSRSLDACQWKPFINEVILLSQIKHKHVVKILGCCLEHEAPLVVYEFISNGTLFEYIQNTSNEFLLTWEMRLQIAYEVATAIAYLHSEFSTPIYHRDIKSSNILLDENLRAKLSDFGISRAVHMEQTHLTTCVQGTFGYLDPEYFYSSQYSEKSDVYSFGVVLVELLTGQKPIRFQQVDEDIEGNYDQEEEEEEPSLVTFFISSMNGGNLFDILDPIVLESSSEEEIMEFANIAKQCINPRRLERPTMKEVRMVLEKLKCRRSSSMPLAPNADHISGWHFRNNSIMKSAKECIYEGPVTYDHIDIIKNANNLDNVDEMRLMQTA